MALQFRVSDLKNSITGLLTGTNLNNVTNLNGALSRAVRVMGNRIDVPEASGIYNLTLYSGVFDYQISDQIFGSTVNDLRPQGVSRQPWDYNYKMPSEMFDRTKGFTLNGYKLTFDYFNGNPIMRVATPNVIERVVLSPMTQTDGFTAGGTASGLTVDTAVYYQQPASLRFLQSTGAGTITFVPQTTIDLSSYEDVGVAFLAIMIPSGATASQLTSIQLKIGSGASDYNNVTETDGFLGAWVSGQWLLVAFDFAGASQTGTPDWNNIDYVEVTVTTSADMTNFRIGGLWISQPAPVQLYYQTAAVFLPDGSSTPAMNISLDTDYILLNASAFNILEYEASKTIAAQMSGGKLTAQIQGFDQVLNGVGSNPGLYAHYMASNPSQELRNIGNYYEDGPYGV